MDSFYTIVLSIAVVILILILTYIGVIMSYNNGAGTFPPQYSMCPDYWNVSSVDSNSCLIPTDVTHKNIGPISKKSDGKLLSSLYDSAGKLLLNKSNTPGIYCDGTSCSGNKLNAINFGDAGWTKSGISPVCAKRTWANNFGIVWDGISNYNSC